MPKKPNVAFVELTCCAGCECALIDDPKSFSDLLSRVKLVEFRLLEECASKIKSYDVTFVVGTPSTSHQVKFLKELREKTKFLVAYGNCSIWGSVWASKNWRDKDDLMKRVYPNPEGIDNLPVLGVRGVVKVDLEIPTCPINPREFYRLVEDLLIGRVPVMPVRPVCYDCQTSGFECVLQKGEPCFGPATLGGCEAICLKNKQACQGCRGPLKGANVNSLLNTVSNLVGEAKTNALLEIFGVKDAFFEAAKEKK